MTRLYQNLGYNKQCSISFSLLVFLCPHVLVAQEQTTKEHVLSQKTRFQEPKEF